MKKRAILFLFSISLISLLFSGCYQNPPTDTGTPIPTEEVVTVPPKLEASPTATTSVEPNELVALLPNQKGFKWVYNGFADYAHEIARRIWKDYYAKVCSSILESHFVHFLLSN